MPLSSIAAKGTPCIFRATPLGADCLPIVGDVAFVCKSILAGDVLGELSRPDPIVYESELGCDGTPCIKETDASCEPNGGTINFGLCGEDYELESFLTGLDTFLDDLDNVIGINGIGTCKSLLLEFWTIYGSETGGCVEPGGMPSYQHEVYYNVKNLIREDSPKSPGSYQTVRFNGTLAKSPIVGGQWPQWDVNTQGGAWSSATNPNGAGVRSKITSSNPPVFSTPDECEWVTVPALG